MCFRLLRQACYTSLTCLSYDGDVVKEFEKDTATHIVSDTKVCYLRPF